MTRRVRGNGGRDTLYGDDSLGAVDGDDTVSGGAEGDLCFGGTWDDVGTPARLEALAG